MSTPKPLSLVLFAVLAVGPSPLQAQGDLTAAIDSVLGLYDRRDGPGCAVGIGQGGRVLLAKGYGMADLEHQIPIAPNTVFHAASLSKQFTAMAALLLVQDGKLDLNLPLGRYLAELPSPTAAVTIRQALQHTGGLRDQWELLAATGWRLGDDLVTNDDILALLRRQRHLNFTPDAEYLYSNSGFTLVARAVERQSGLPFARFVAERIFTPLSMAATRFDDGHSAIVVNRANGHAEQDDGSWRLRSPHYATVGATGLLTTVEDLLRWGHNFTTGDVGGVARGALAASAVLTGGDSTHYGLGIGLTPLGDRPAFGHAGSDPGFTSYLLHVPDGRLTVALLCNVGAVPTGALARRIARRVLGDAHPRVTPLPWRAEPDSGKLGWYWNQERERLWLIQADSGRLLGTPDGSVTQFRLRFLGENRYRVGDGPAELEFETPAAGEMIQRHADDAPYSIRYRRRSSWRPSNTTLRQLVGRYRSDEVDAEYSLALTGDTLILKRPRQRPLPLSPAFRDAFLAEGTVVRIERRRDRPIALLVTRPRLRSLRFDRVR